MKKVLIVLSSVRENRIADKILEYVKTEFKNYPELEYEVADFKVNPLPLIDSPHNPSSEEFAPTNENVNKWTKQVEEADNVLILVAEYNHSFTPVIKNAIDWLYRPWNEKPVAFIGYGWAGGSRAIKHLRDVFASNINAKANDIEANLHFKKEIELDGEPIDNNEIKKSINNVLESL